MNPLTDYLLGANFCLLFFLGIYFISLRNETAFQTIRIYLLESLVVSMLFPAIHFQTSAGIELIPFVENGFSLKLLPEVFISHNYRTISSLVSIGSSSYFKFISWIYFAGLIIAASIFLFKLIRLIKLMGRSKTYRYNQCWVAESKENPDTFSFFRFIWLGQANKLSEDEKQIILRHECIHAIKFHSFDILLVNCISVIFWFNPFITLYKKKLVELHEFEADAYAVAHNDLYQYCNLLGSVALHSTGFPLANHFTNSLILKRIAMIQTTKSKIKVWKLIALLATLPLTLLVVSCEQENLGSTLQYPKEVENAVAKLKKIESKVKFAVAEVAANEDFTVKTNALIEAYKLPISSIQVFDKKDDKGYVVVSFKQSEKPFVQTVAITMNRKADVQASFPGGIEAFIKYVGQNFQYPEASRKKAIEGRIVVEFEIKEDGTIGEMTILKGLDVACNEEALRVISESPVWNPAMKGGIAVDEKLIVPMNIKP